jgi:hypothetical protein
VGEPEYLTDVLASIDAELKTANRHQRTGSRYVGVGAHSDAVAAVAEAQRKRLGNDWNVARHGGSSAIAGRWVKSVVLAQAGDPSAAHDAKSWVESVDASGG